MKSAILVPHCDDETLFASHIVAKYDPEVKLVYRPREPDEWRRREAEMSSALTRLMAQVVDPYMVEWLGGYEGEVMNSLEEQLQKWVPPKNFLSRDPEADYIDFVFAPLPEKHGHLEHNHVGQAAWDVYGPGRVQFYATYTRNGGRSTTNAEVVFPPWLISRKLEALSVYKSQMEHPARAPWFFQLLDLREWVADEPA